MMRMRGLWILACLLLALRLAAQADGPPMVALVSSLSGHATINDKAAALLSPMASGDVVELKAGANAVLSFVEGGVRVTLQGPCRGKVTPKGVDMLSGATTKVDRPVMHQGQKVAIDINVNKMGGTVTRRADVPTVFSYVGDPATVETTPHFSWRVKDGAPAEMHIRINNADTYDQKWTVPGDSDGFTVPASQALTPGGDYCVFLSYVDDSGHHEAPVTTLKVLSAADAARLSAIADAAHAAVKASPQDTTPLVQLIDTYNDQHLYGPALTEVTTLAEQHPDDRNLVFLMGFLHKQRHETEQAEALYSKAMSLGFPADSIPR